MRRNVYGARCQSGKYSLGRNASQVKILLLKFPWGKIILGRNINRTNFHGIPDESRKEICQGVKSTVHIKRIIQGRNVIRHKKQIFQKINIAQTPRHGVLVYHAYFIYSKFYTHIYSC
jgi:hypothetical protein